MFNIQNAPSTLATKRRVIQKVAQSHSEGKVQNDLRTKYLRTPQIMQII